MKKSVLFWVAAMGLSTLWGRSVSAAVSDISCENDSILYGDTIPTHVGGGEDDSIVVVVPPAVDPNDSIPSPGGEDGDSAVVITPPVVDPDDTTPPASGGGSGDSAIVIFPNAGPDVQQPQEQKELSRTILSVTGNIDEFFAIDSKYIKDWQIRFVTPEYGAEALQLGIRKDTLLNGAMYQMVERGDNRVTVDSLYYRQVGDKVFRFSEETGQDVLLFDFGLKEGDTFMAPDGEEWVVDQVDETACIADHEGCAWVLKGKTDNALKDIWQQGIGSVYTGILPYGEIDRTKLPRVAYCRQFGVEWLIYVHQFKLNEECYKVGFFRPESSDEVTGPWWAKAAFIEDTLHVYGAMELFPYNYVTECRIQGNSIHVRIEDITNVDSDGLIMRNFGVKIPGFKSGNYDVVLYTSKYDKRGTDLGSIACSASNGIVLPTVKQPEICVDGRVISCVSQGAALLEIYTPGGIKASEAAFRNGAAAVKVSGTSGTYLYVVTYEDEHRTSGKVTIK